MISFALLLHVFLGCVSHFSQFQFSLVPILGSVHHFCQFLFPWVFNFITCNVLSTTLIWYLVLWDIHLIHPPNKMEPWFTIVANPHKYTLETWKIWAKHHLYHSGHTFLSLEVAATKDRQGIFSGSRSGERWLWRSPWWSPRWPPKSGRSFGWTGCK
jgi:hypothetical protein